MKTAMSVPKRSMDARPMSLRSFSSWRIESCPRSRPESIIRMAKTTRLYRTRSRTVSRKVFGGDRKETAHPSPHAEPPRGAVPISRKK